MGVFKDDQIVARVLGRQPQPLKKDNSKFLAIAGCAAAVLGLTAWAVIERKNSALSDAEVVAIPATAAVTAPKAEGAPLFTAAAPAKTPTSDAKKRLPPVIEDFSVESVEINPKFTVRLSDVAPAAADRKPVDAARSVEVSMDAGENYESAKKLEESAKGVPAKLERARALYQKALESGRLPVPLETNCLARLNDLTAKLVLDPKAICTEPKAEFHKVESGEVVEKIAKKFKVNQGQIKRVNHLNDKLSVRVGQTLKLLQGETVFKVDKEKLTGTLYIDGVFIKRFPVGIGPGNATPKGTFTIENKLVNPDWFYEGKKYPFGDAKNILGSRWMGMANTASGANGAGLGVHGTAIPESVPGRESKGCVRMHNEDVEELYDFMPQGGKVVIE
ncbi:MAG: L,D-transpeptidase family protein [Planctomycetota bacterium]